MLIFLFALNELYSTSYISICCAAQDSLLLHICYMLVKIYLLKIINVCLLKQV